MRLNPEPLDQSSAALPTKPAKLTWTKISSYMNISDINVFSLSWTKESTLHKLEGYGDDEEDGGINGVTESNGGNKMEE